MATFKIYPIRLGHSEQDYAFSFARAKFGQKIVWFMHGCFLLKNNENGEVTMMDTGSRHWTEVEKYNLPWTTNVEKGPTLKEAMAELGVAPEDVKQIILTHLHHDHCANLEIFPKDTPIYVQKAEFASACAPSPAERFDYTWLPYHNCPYWKEHILQFVGVEGDYEIEPGLKLLFTPGHTTGSQSVLVDTEEGQYCYGGDMYYCQENIDLGHQHGNCVSVVDWQRSHTKIMQTGAKPLALHIPEVFDRKVYG